MHKLSSKLRIGEKIALSFGVVAFLFLLVIWRYHTTLENALTDYRVLQDIYEAKETHATNVALNLLMAKTEAKGFLVDRDPTRLQSVDDAIKALTDEAIKLGEVDESGHESAERIKALASVYQLSFHDVYNAWERRGLDHDSGLQGAFRETVHELEDLADHYEIDSLYIDLLQIRRGEKDLGLRRESVYRDSVLRLLDNFQATLVASELESSVKENLEAEIEIYRDAFQAYAIRVLNNEDIQGGKGPFRQAAHRIEAILTEHRIPDLDANILQMRRREKDYLLRLDQRYVEMTLSELQGIRTSVDASRVATSEKENLGVLLADYERDFLALVEQNRVIDQLHRQMESAADAVFALADETVADANQATLDATARINAEAQRNAQLMGWIVFLAVLLSIVLGLVITRLITKPLIDMAGFLDRLALEAPVDRIPTVENSRNEVAAMAESVNRMADHKARMLDWWKSSVEEMDTERDRWVALSNSNNDPASLEAATAAAEHREAIRHRASLLRLALEEMQREAETIAALSAELGDEGMVMSKAAKEILSRIDIVLTQNTGT